MGTEPSRVFSTNGSLNQIREHARLGYGGCGGCVERDQRICHFRFPFPFEFTFLF